MYGPWYILQTVPGRESVAADWFVNRQRAETYYPVATRLIRPSWRRSKTPIEVTRPAFTGYIFARFPTDVDWHYASYNPHYVGAVENNDAPVVIRDEVVHNVRMREVRGDFVSPLCSEDLLRQVLVGMPAHVPYGPFVGMKAVTVEDVKKNMVTLCVRILGHDTSVTFPLYDVFPELLNNPP